MDIPASLRGFGRCCMYTMASLPDFGCWCMHTTASLRDLGRCCMYTTASLRGFGCCCMHTTAPLRGFGRCCMYTMASLPDFGCWCMGSPALHQFPYRSTVVRFDYRFLARHSGLRAGILCGIMRGLCSNAQHIIIPDIVVLKHRQTKKDRPACCGTVLFMLLVLSGLI